MIRALVAGVGFALFAAACATDEEAFEPDPEPAVTDTPGLECQWPMFGQNPGRTFTYDCESGITTSSVSELRRIWFFNTDDVVSASPVVVNDRLYVGDWTGVFYSLDAATGDELWRTTLSTNPLQYGGQISASASFAEIDGDDALVVASGLTVHALRAEDGTEIWSRPLGREGTTTEILGSPLAIGNLAIVAFDAHGAAEPTGIVALDIETGDEVWYFDPELGNPAGCGGIWGSPTVDIERGLVFAGTANCPESREGWTIYSEALFALDISNGEPQWTFQPHEPNDRDTDFAGAPNLFTAGGRDLVGLGNKDAHYYALDRATGELVWDTMATDDGYIGPNFSSGGFVGPSSVSDGLVISATAVGDCPCMHAMDAATGAIVWQQLSVGPSYAPTTTVGGVAFVASIDTVLRALDISTGEVLWSDSLGVLASGGIATIGNDLWAVAGFREPGSSGPSTTSGVFRYTVDPDVPSSTTTTTTTTTLPVEDRPAVRLVDAAGRCVDAPCPLSFGIKDPPAGTDPSLTISITTDPFSITVESSGLGDPGAWIREGSDAAAVGATSYGLMISERDDDPNGGFLCVLGESGRCTGSSVPNPGASYNRITVLALADTEAVPDAVDGFSRLVDSISFNPPLQTELIGTATSSTAAPGTIVLSGQGNDLVAYDIDGNRQLVISNAADDPDNGLDINAQVCFLDDDTFIAGEDTGQPDIVPGWGVFDLVGDAIGEFEATRVGRLVPTYQPADSQPEMFGCGVLPDGRVVLTDVGNQASGPGTGQLMMFFPPTNGFRGEITEHCKLDIEIATAQQIAIDGETVLVAAARPPTVGVWRYSDLPQSLADCEGDLCVGCDMSFSPTRELFIDAADGGLGIANGIASAPNGGWYVGSVFTGVINEYDRNGGFVREILRPPEGETLGPEPYSTGTPAGITVTANGSLWYADLAIVVRDGGGIGPRSGIGTVRVIRFVDGAPQPPEIVDDGLAFPDVVSVIP